MNTPRFPLTPVFAAVLAGTALLSACGGDDSDTSSGPPPVTTQDVTTNVLDGALQNATVCLDKNDNGGCDAGEPSAKTAADGSATLKVDLADVGKFTLLALVGTDAVDAKTGPVPTAYSMRTPADQTGLISALTTLVHAKMAQSGSTSTVADKAVQDAAGVSASMFSDFSKGADPASLAAIARLVVVAKQRASISLTAATDTVTLDSSGATITQADVDRSINNRLLELLPSIVAGATSAAVSGATGSAKDDAIKAAAQALVTNELALTVETLKVVLGSTRTPDASAATPAAGANLSWFTYTDAANWYFRYFSGTAAQNTPDANGRLRFVDNRKRAVAGAVQAWGDPAFARTDAWFDGTAWSVCPVNFENSTTPRDAQGRSATLYCNAYSSTSVRSVRDISGLRMADIASEIRAYPLTSTQGLYSQWGPEPTLLGAAAFPPNSKLFYQVTTQLSNPDGYNTAATNTVKTYAADVVAGGTPVFDSNGVASLACGNVTSANSASLLQEVLTLEQLVASFPGKPCVFGTNANTGPRNEWWSNSSVNIGTVAGPAPVTSLYQSNRVIRAAFGAGNTVAYLNCAVRIPEGSSRNCDPAGTGSYSIEAVGDARVLRFANVPAVATTLTYNRLFVERGGKVYYGYRDKLRVDHAVRLNAEGMDALLGQLNLTR